jgi:TRAP-type C4-dicarboxylate transport system substrate-binding protein
MTLADWKGLKIRVPEVPLFVETFKALGATPTPIPAPEIYSALQTGIVDAQEGSPDWMYGLKTYEIVKNLMLTAHLQNPEGSIVSEAWWRRQSEDVQRVVGEAGREAWDWYAQEREKQGTQGVGDLQKAGMTTYTPDRAELAKAVQPVYDSFAKTLGVGDLIQKIRDLK